MQRQRCLRSKSRPSVNKRRLIMHTAMNLAAVRPDAVTGKAHIGIGRHHRLQPVAQRIRQQAIACVQKYHEIRQRCGKPTIARQGDPFRSRGPFKCLSHIRPQNRCAQAHPCPLCRTRQAQD